MADNGKMIFAVNVKWVEGDQTPDEELGSQIEDAINALFTDNLESSLVEKVYIIHRDSRFDDHIDAVKLYT